MISKRRRLAIQGTVAGLTWASLGVIPRVWAAEEGKSTVEKAAGSAISAAKPTLEAPDVHDDQLLWDVVVVGSGLAGAAASLSALESGAKRVIMIEKGPLIGGHSAYSTGTLAVVNSERQKRQGVDDSLDRMWAEAKTVGGSTADEHLIRKIGEESGAALAWLEAYGVTFSPGVFQSLGGLTPRSVLAKSAQPGLTYTRALYEAALKRGLLVRMNTRMTNLVPQDGGEQGRFWVVEWVRHQVPGFLRTRSVVIATGGFTANAEMIRRHDPTIPAGMRTTANPKGLYFDGAEGDGILIAEAVGAQLKDMDNIQLMPIWGGRLLDYVGGDIFLDHEGRRFVNEGASWKTLEAALLKLPNQTMWVVTDAQSKKGISLGVKLADGTVKKSDTIAEMAIGMGVDPSVLQKTLDEYNRNAANKTDPLFGKTTFTQLINQPPYYWGEERLFLHTTLGGIAINEHAEVLDKSSRPIEGLYAAGETVGGLFGKSRLGGLAMTACVVFGHEAGRMAAARAVGRVASPLIAKKGS